MAKNKIKEKKVGLKEVKVEKTDVQEPELTAEEEIQLQQENVKILDSEEIYKIELENKNEKIRKLELELLKSSRKLLDLQKEIVQGRLLLNNRETTILQNQLEKESTRHSKERATHKEYMGTLKDKYGIESDEWGFHPDSGIIIDKKGI